MLRSRRQRAALPFAANRMRTPTVVQQEAVECGAAHGALAMTTPGDTTMATLAEVERVMKGRTARVVR